MAGFASWLFGLPVQQPREYRRLMRIRSRVYTPIARLDAEILRSAEPIPFDQLDRTAFVPLRPGTHWGKVFDCAWLRITGDVPAGVDHPVVMLGIRGEGLVHSRRRGAPRLGEHRVPAGRPAEQRRPVSAGAERRHLVAEDRVLRRRHLQRLDPLRGGPCRLPRRPSRDPRRRGPRPLLRLPHPARAGGGDRGRRARIRAAAITPRRLRALHEGRSAGARAALAERLSAPSTSEFVYSAVGHGHLDMAWLWPLRETRRKAARTYVRALNAIDRRDDYIYGTSQPQQMAWMKERHPALFERMRRAVAEGRMELQGSFWVEPDTNLPSGESLVRQALVGRRFLQEEFGLTDDQLRLCWLPDTFGYNGNLPQILRGTGMDWFQTIKLAWNKVNDFPHRTFHWQGIDGSTVLVHMPPEGDYNSRGAADNLLTGLRQYPERALNTALLVYGSGDGGGGPNEIHHEVTRREQNLRGLPRVEYSSAGGLLPVARAARPRRTPTSASCTSRRTRARTRRRAAIKRHNRLVERKLHEVEALAVLTGDDSRARARGALARGAAATSSTTSSRARRSRASTARRSRPTSASRRTSTSTPTSSSAACRARGRRSTALNLTSLPRDEFVKTRRGLVPRGGARRTQRRRSSPRATFPELASTARHPEQRHPDPAIRRRRERSSRASTATAPSTPPTASTGSSCTRIPTSGRSTPGTSRPTT